MNMQKISSEQKHAKKLNGKGSIPYDIWINKDTDEIFVQMHQSSEGGNVTNGLFYIGYYINYYICDLQPKEFRWHEQQQDQNDYHLQTKETANNSNDWGFLKAVIRHLVSVNQGTPCI